MKFRVLRIQEVMKISGLARSTIYLFAKQGVWPQPIRLAKKVSGWPEEEVISILRARACGKTDAEVRALVSYLHSRRAIAFRDLAQEIK